MMRHSLIKGCQCAANAGSTLFGQLLEAFPAAPLSSHDALWLVSYLFDDASTDAELTARIVSRCVHVVNESFHQTSLALSSLDTDDDAVLCVGIMQRTLLYRTEHAPSLPASATFGVRQLFLPHLTTRDGASGGDDRVRAQLSDTVLALVTGLETPLINCVCASLEALELPSTRTVQVPKATSPCVRGKDGCGLSRHRDPRRPRPHESKTHFPLPTTCGFWRPECVAVVCATLLLYTAASSFPGAADRYSVLLKTHVRRALQWAGHESHHQHRQHHTSRTRQDSASLPLPPRQQAQALLFFTELLFRVGPTLVSVADLISTSPSSLSAHRSTTSTAHTPTTSEHAHQQPHSQQHRLYRDSLTHAAHYRACLTVLARDIRRRNTVHPQITNRIDDENDVLWHLETVASWLSRLPVTLPVMRAESPPHHAPTLAMAEADCLLPTTDVILAALDVVDTVMMKKVANKNAPSSSFSDAHAVARVWRCLVQIGFSTSLHHAVKHLSHDPAHLAHAETSQSVRYRCLVLLVQLLSVCPALLSHVGSEAELVWGQAVAVVASTAITTHTILTMADLVSAHAHLLLEGLHRIMPTAALAKVAAHTVPRQLPSRDFLLSFLRAWVAWMPELSALCAQESHRPLSSSSRTSVSSPPPPPPAVMALMRSMEDVNAHLAVRSPVVASVGTTGHHPNTYTARPAGFPVLHASASLRPHTASSSMSRASDEVRVNDGNGASGTPRQGHVGRSGGGGCAAFMRCLEDTIVMHWTDALHRDLVLETSLADSGVLHDLCALTELTTQAALLHEPPREGWETARRSLRPCAEARHASCLDWRLSVDCPVRLRTQSISFVSSTLDRRTRSASIRQDQLLSLPALLAFQCEHAGLLPSFSGPCVSTGERPWHADGVAQVMPQDYVSTWNILSDPAASRLRALLQSLLPPLSIEPALALHQTAFEQACEDACRERGVHRDATVYGIYRAGSQHVSTWLWGAVMTCGHLVDPTCPSRLAVATAVIWHSAGHAMHQDNARLRRAGGISQDLATEMTSAGECARGPSCLSLAPTRREAALDWFISHAAEAKASCHDWEDVYIVVPHRGSFPPQPSSAGRSGVLVAVRCACWDAQGLWDSLCRGYACASRRHGGGKDAIDMSPLALQAECLYAVLCEADRAEDSSRESASTHLVRDHLHRDDTLHSLEQVLSLCEVHDYVDEEAAGCAGAGAEHATQVDMTAWVECFSRTFCTKILAALLVSPATLLQAQRIPMPFLLRLLQRCLAPAQATCSASNASELDQWHTWFATLVLVTAVRDLLARIGDAEDPERQLTVLHRLKSTLHDVVGTSRVGSVLFTAAEPLWEELAVTCRVADWPLSAVLLHMLLEERALIQTVVVVLQRAKVYDERAQVSLPIDFTAQTLSEHLSTALRTRALHLASNLVESS